MSVSANRPVGVGEAGEPTVTAKERTTRPPSSSRASFDERSTSIEYRVQPERSTDGSSFTQPSRPFGSSGAGTPAQPPRPSERRQHRARAEPRPPAKVLDHLPSGPGAQRDPLSGAKPDDRLAAMEEAQLRLERSRGGPIGASRRGRSPTSLAGHARGPLAPEPSLREQGPSARGRRPRPAGPLPRPSRNGASSDSFPGPLTPEAEREGFEPSRELAPPTRLAGECLQPLGHLSGAAPILGRTDRARDEPRGPLGRRYSRAAVSANRRPTVRDA